MSQALVGASAWEERLYQHLASHMGNEVELLTAYQAAAAESDSKAFQYLVSIIVDDEKRHHRVFEELANALRSDVELRPVEPAVPDMAGFGKLPEKVVRPHRRPPRQGGRGRGRTTSPLTRAARRSRHDVVAVARQDDGTRHREARRDLAVRAQARAGIDPLTVSVARLPSADFSHPSRASGVRCVMEFGAGDRRVP